MSKQIVDIKGMRFGRLVALEDSGQRDDSGGSVLWRCICDCGTVHIARGRELRRGGIVSCGCRGIPKPDRITTHYEGPVIARDEAVALRLTRYFTSEPCPYGHIAQRSVSTWGCCECHRLRQHAPARTKQLL